MVDRVADSVWSSDDRQRIREDNRHAAAFRVDPALPVVAVLQGYPFEEYCR